MPGGDDIGRDARVVEVVQYVLADDEATAARPLLKLGGLADELLVVPEKWCRVSQSPSTSACRMNRSREVTGSIWEKATVRSATIGIPYSVTFSVATAAPRLRDHRGAVGPSHEMLGQRLYPLRVDRGGHPAPQP